MPAPDAVILPAPTIVGALKSTLRALTVVPLSRKTLSPLAKIAPPTALVVLLLRKLTCPALRRPLASANRVMEPPPVFVTSALMLTLW